MLAEENAHSLAQGGTMVFLDAPFAVCYERIRQSDRPLVRQNSRDRLHEIFLYRRPIYLSRAQLTADAAAAAVQTAESILLAIQKA